MKYHFDYSPSPMKLKTQNWDFVFSSDIHDHMSSKKRESNSAVYKKRYKQKNRVSHAQIQRNRQHALNDQLAA